MDVFRTINRMQERIAGKESLKTFNIPQFRRENVDSGK
jgi:hypothetical protein